MRAPSPLGAVPQEGGTDFAVWSEQAQAISVALFSADGDQEIGRVRLERGDDFIHRAFVRGVGPGARYGLRADGPYAPSMGDWFDPDKLLVDPYAQQLDRPFQYDPRLTEARGACGDTAPLVPKAIVPFLLPPLAPKPPLFPPGGLIYELSVRAFTLRHPEVPPAQRGTLAALAHPAVLAHLTRLGVDAVEVMPITPWIDERHLAPLGLRNAWGYNPVCFMALDPRLAPGGVMELRETVSALHQAGIGVILDLVFNHSGEGDMLGPVLSLRGLDNRAYYRAEPEDPGRLVNDSGCGNCLNGDHAAVRRLIVDSLRHFVTAAGIDGFRFDLATILGRTARGFDPDAALFQEIRADRQLADRLMIAEPWDIGPDGYQLGRFPDNFLEWNDRYRDDLRRFWRGDSGVKGALATRLAGSSDVFGQGAAKVSRTVNFIAAHDGLTLADLVSFEQKHNLANGEDNRDGTWNNLSWNNGVEGPSADIDVQAARRADHKALLASLFASRGAIMLTAGDEFGRSQAGNNNAYCQDNELVWLDWLHRDQELENWVGDLARLRRDHPTLREPAFLTSEDVTWLTRDAKPCQEGDWHDNDGCLMMQLRGEDSIAVLFNRERVALSFTLPPGDWRKGDDIVCGTMTVAPRSVVFLVAATRYMTNLERLAELAGINPGWWDFFGHYRQVPSATKRALLSAMGFTLSSEAALAQTVSDFIRRAESRWLEPVILLEEDAQDIVIPLTLPPAQRATPIGWRIETEQGPPFDGVWQPSLREAGEQSECASMLLPVALPLGLHRLVLEGGGSSTLVVAPRSAYQPPEFATIKQFWGYAVQCYALQSPSNWGIGDLGDLGELAKLAAGQGASILGINPLHALFPHIPARCSPYFPSSRSQLNFTAIDVTDVPDFANSREAQALYHSARFQERLEEVRDGTLIDHGAIADLKRQILTLCWQEFSTQILPRSDHCRTINFQAFRDREGPSLARFALFEALCHHFKRQTGVTDWRQWPIDYQDPESDQVAEFARSDPDQLGFFCYLQWLADQQLAEVQNICRQNGMALGLYRDLAVAIAGDGAEAWACQDLLCRGVAVGAPPDPLNLAGQNWGLAPYNPLALRAAAYRPFIAALDANMRHAGVIRLDHVMSLARLYWVPDGFDGDQGAYVSYPVDELMALVRLASVRHRCVVIGEDLGNVPADFRGRMRQSGLLGYRMLVFEKEASAYRAPGQIDRDALVTFGSHDLPSLSGWWQGTDIEVRQTLRLYPGSAMERREREERKRDRRQLAMALTAEDLLPARYQDLERLDDVEARALAIAVYRYLHRSSARFLLVQFEDTLGVATQMNLPGTVDEHPNWRQRYPLPVTTLLADPTLLAILAHFG